MLGSVLSLLKSCDLVLKLSFLTLLFTSTTLLSAQIQRSPDIEKYLQAAQDAEKSKDYARSAEAYLEILKIRPDLALIHQSLGVVYHLQNLFPEAIMAFQKALSLDQNLWGSRLFLGMGYYRTNQFSKAIPELQKAMELNPRQATADALHWLASSYLALGQFEESVQQWQRLVQLKPRDLEVLYNLAQAYSRFSSSLFEEMGRIDLHSAEAHRLQAEWFESQDRPVIAIEEYAKAAELRPDWEGIYSAIGNVYLRLGDFENARNAFEEELKITPEDEMVRHQLANSLQKMGRQDAPVKSDPDSPESKDGFGRTPLSQGIRLFRARKYKEAKQTLGEVVNTQPADTTARLYLARSYYVLEDYPQSIQLLQDLRKAGAQNLEVLYWLGKSYQELASSTLQKMIDIDPASYRVFQMSGKLYEEKTQFPKALEAYKTVMKLSPDLAGIRSDIGNVYRKMQDSDEALIWLKQELAVNPYHALTNYRVGDILMTKGRSDQAIPYLEQAVQANPRLLEAQRQLGKALLEQQQYNRALEKLLIVAQGEPEDEGTHYLLATIYRKLGDSEKAKVELQRFNQLNGERLERDRQRVARKILRDSDTKENHRNP
jgi:tetratricopeptide (TPR) repeat protein